MYGRTTGWDSLISGVYSRHWLNATMKRVSFALSEMVNHSISNDTPHLKTVPVAQAVMHTGNPEEEVAGVYLEIEGDLYGRAILILPISSALSLVDLLTDVPSGTTTSLDDMGRSALAEVGNLMVSSFLNAMVSSLLVGMPWKLKPSPPAVVVDMLGAILDLIVTPAAAIGDDMLVVETTFRDATRAVQAHFWVVPGPGIGQGEQR